MTLRRRLALAGVATLALVLAAVAAASYQLVRVQGRADVDRRLAQELAEVSVALPALLDAEAGGATATAGELVDAAQRHLALNPGSDLHLTAVEVGGRLLATSDGPGELADLLDDGDLPTGTTGAVVTVDTDAGPVRVLSAPLESAGGDPVGTVRVLAPLGDVRRDAVDALSRVALTGAAGLVLGGLVLVVVTRGALAPLGRLAAAARRTGAADLTARVPEPAGTDELGELAHEFNRMLDRIAASAEERRRLLAALSHELRTPVAVAMGHLELLEGLGPTDEQDAAATAAVVRAELVQLTRLIDDLSDIAHGDDGARIELGPVFLPDLFDDLRVRVQALAGEQVTVAAPPPAVVEADHDRLGQSLLNLVRNAVEHTPAGTTATVSATVDGAAVALVVADDGPGLDPALAGSATEPFVSGRPSGAERSSGLGLAVVRALTEAQGGRFELASGPGGTTARLVFPVATV